MTLNSLARLPEIQTKVSSKISDAHDPWHVCCGHDLIELLSATMGKSVPMVNGKNCAADTLETCLRLSYEPDHFKSTTLYAGIRHWETTNDPSRTWHIALTSPGLRDKFIGLTLP